MRRITAGGVKRRVGRELLRVSTALGAMPPQPSSPVKEPFAAGFEGWLLRRGDRLAAPFPGVWRELPVPTAPVARVAVVLHVFFVDLVDPILEALTKIPVDFDLIVTNSSGTPLELDVSGLSHVGRVQVFDLNNQGRDILPLMSLVNADVLEPYELVLKVHTKKSAWREDHPDLVGSGAEWRDGFFRDLLGSEDSVRNILSAFATDPALGIVTSTDSIVGSEFWGGDKEIVRSLLRRLQLELNEESLQFASGSMYWIRGFVLQGLRALQTSEWDFEAEHGQVDGTTAHAIERLIGIVTREAGYELREARDLTVTESSPDWSRYSRETVVEPRARAIPFYLPQFHTFPENDTWWGKGFTEWTNVAGAQPIYDGQNQPLLPSELGFYDLRAPGVRAAQYALAKSAGIEGFMYYYYWFAGKKLMDLPVEKLVSNTGNEPFCIMWANENWTRRWDGRESNVLIGQDYDKAPAADFIHDVIHLLKDSRYIQIDGKPVLAVYRITQLPDFEDVIRYWREYAESAGLPGLTLLSVDVGTSYDGLGGDIRDHGMDAFLEFPPHNKHWAAWEREGTEFDDRFQGNTLRYDSMVQQAELTMLEGVDDARFPGVMVNYDNTARRQWQPDLWWGSNPYTFRRWLNSTVSAVAHRERDQRVVFINAWNEWAESAVLEPTLRFGKSYLLAVRDVLYR